MISNPTIDVIIPTYKPSAELKELLTRLMDQTVKPRHILIMNTEEKFWDLSLTEGIDTAEVYHITKNEFDHGGTRAAAAEMSDADILMFMTQDAMPYDSHLIENLTAPFADCQVKAAYARQLPRKDSSLIETYTRHFNYPKDSVVRTGTDMKHYGIKTYFCSNVCSAYDHDFYRAIGGFVSPCIFNEDMIFGGKLIKAGWSIAYAADARVYHSHNYGAMEQFHRYFDNGVSQADHPEIFKGVPSADEGMRLVKMTARYLKKQGLWYKIPGLVWVSGWKFLGFRLGKAYRHLPRKMVRAFSLNKSYWDIKVDVE